MLPVVVTNDVRALTVAEHWFGVGVDADSFAVVTIGSGVGCGLYINGEVVSGAYGVSGELGHLPLAPGDLVCTCGRRGCVETVASSDAILARVARDDRNSRSWTCPARSSWRTRVTSTRGRRSTGPAR